MNILLREMKANRKALIIWSLCMILFVLMGMQKYEGLVGSGANTADFTKMIDSMPKVIQTMWGISSLDITSPIGYYGILFPFLLLMAGIHSSMLGANIISKEERDKTIEFLMTKPVSRNTIITSKIMASLTNIVVFNIVTFVTTIIFLSSYTTDSILIKITLATIGMFFVQLLFMVIGIGMATMSKNYKKSGSTTVFILISCYFLSLIIDMTGKLDMLNFLTPFKYFDAKNFLVTDKLNVGYIVLSITIIIAILIPAYRKYNKRDFNF
ncbi:MAG: ABC transporter permease subunit [Clostridia bacterium]|nr:ABC transporter permease subunit [Clostridia bacterium]MDD4387237.1 ABC transporter permease subunit [Clostridia bacterium]